MTYSNDPDRLRAGGNRWENNHMAVAAAFGVVAAGSIWYALHNYSDDSAATKVPAAASATSVNPSPVAGPATSGRP
jgi:hypothetical protein